MDKITRLLEQLSVCLEHEALQPRLAMKANGPSNTKTRQRTESAATAVQAMHEDSCTTAQKVQDGPKTSISFSVMAEPPDLPCREDVLVKDGATSPESCLPSLEIRSSTAAGGLVPTGKASTATETNFYQPPLRFYTTEETDSETNSKETKISTLTAYVSYDSNGFQESNPPGAPFRRRVVETKSRKNRTFDPDASQGHPRACPFFWIVARVGLW